MVSVGDVDRWEPEEVRAVFAQVQKQLRTIEDSSAVLVGLPAFSTWGGPAGEAAARAVGKTVKSSRGHAEEIRQIGIAANDAADEIGGIKRELAEMRETASRFGMRINSDNSVDGEMPVPPFRLRLQEGRQMITRVTAGASIQCQIRRIVA